MSRALREALESVCSVEVAGSILGAAMVDGGFHEPPSSADELEAFVFGPLRAEIAAVLGDETATEVVAELVGVAALMRQLERGRLTHSAPVARATPPESEERAIPPGLREDRANRREEDTVRFEVEPVATHGIPHAGDRAQEDSTPMDPKSRVPASRPVVVPSPARTSRPSAPDAASGSVESATRSPDATTPTSPPPPSSPSLTPSISPRSSMTSAFGLARATPRAPSERPATLAAASAFSSERETLPPPSASDDEPDIEIELGFEGSDNTIPLPPPEPALAGTPDLWVITEDANIEPRLRTRFPGVSSRVSPHFDHGTRARVVLVDTRLPAGRVGARWAAHVVPDATILWPADRHELARFLDRQPHARNVIAAGPEAELEDVLLLVQVHLQQSRR